MTARSRQETSAEAAKRRDLVVLLHGLARTRFSMWPLKRSLQRKGYATLNVGYPSTRKTPEELVAFLHQQMGTATGARATADPAEAPARASDRTCPGREQAGAREDSSSTAQSRVHFVTHSLGGVLLRAYLARYEIPRLGRIVQLTPPNQGSEIVDRIGGLRLFGWIFGPTGRALGTMAQSLPQRLTQKPPAEVGVIAGARSLNPLGKALLPGPGDGAVTLERTRFGGGGEADWIAMPIDHTTIMQRKSVAYQVEHFLRCGAFDHEAANPGR